MNDMALYTVDDVMKLTGTSRTKSYDIIKKLNDELKEKGFLVISGKISKEYFEERYYKVHSEL